MQNSKRIMLHSPMFLKVKKGWVLGTQERGWELPQVHLLPDRTTGRTGCRGSLLVCAVLPSSRRAGRLVTERQLGSGSGCVWSIATACKEIHMTMALWYIMFKMIEYMAGPLNICYFWCACHPLGQPSCFRHCASLCTSSRPRACGAKRHQATKPPDQPPSVAGRQRWVAAVLFAETASANPILLRPWY